MRKINKFLIPAIISIAIFSVLVMPLIVRADNPLVPCNNTPDPNTGVIAQPCDFNAFMTLINNVIHFILYAMVVPIAAIMFAYAGFLLVTAGGEAAHAKTKAKAIFTNTAIGLAIAAAAFLIVRVVLSILGYNGGWIGF